MTSKPQSTTQRWSRWQEVRPQSVSSRIVDQVRAALFRGELKPGDVLGSETDLAKKFGVSRVPVRDAAVIASRWLAAVRWDSVR